MLTRLCSKFFKLDFSSEPRTSGCKNWTYKRQRNQISNCQHPSFHTKIKAIQKRKKERKIYFCFIDYIKDFVWVATNCEKFLKRWEYQTTLPVSQETCMQDKRQQLEPCMEQQAGSKSGKEYVKSVYCHCILYIVHHEKCQAGWLTKQNQDCQENYQ